MHRVLAVVVAGVVVAACSGGEVRQVPPIDRSSPSGDFGKSSLSPDATSPDALSDDLGSPSPQVPSTETSSTPDARLVAPTVAIGDFDYQPATLRITPGTTITWTNQDSIVHTVTFRDLDAGSDDLKKGEMFEHTFTEVGTYAYFCEFHGNMEGTVEVTDSSR